MIGLFWGAIGGMGWLLLLARPSARVSSRHIRLHHLLISLVFAAATMLLHVPALAVVAFAATVAYLRQLDIQKHEKILQQRAAAWPDAIDFLISSVRAGMPIGSSLLALCDQGPEELRDLLRPVRDSLLAGLSVREALAMLRRHAQDPVADRITVVLEIAQHVGGTSLATVLRSLSAYVRSESRTRSEMISRQSWTINAAKLAAAAPWIIVVILSLRAHQAYATFTGTALLLVGATATFLGYLWMRASARLPLLERLG